jgi:hypothetical protein
MAIFVLCRALMVRNNVIDSYKHLVVAISAGNISRIDSLLCVELKNGTGIFGILQKVDQAAHLAYHVKSYEEADYHWAYLLWKLGGWAVANIAHHTLGVPSLDMA